MDRLLIVSYLFPPCGGIGVQRALSLAKYLPRSGFEIDVLRATNAAGPVHDPGLLRHIPDSVSVHGAFSPQIPFGVRQKIWKYLSRSRPSSADGATTQKPATGWKSGVQRLARRILCPEPEILWVPFAARKARAIVRRRRIDAVLVTVPPFSALLVGCKLKREFPRLTLISDFRDEWLTFYLKDFDFQGGEHTRRRAVQIERTSIELSDLVVAVTPSSRDEIRKRYPDQPDAKFACLPNGYDPEIFAGFAARPHQPGSVIVTHLGTVYKTASPRYYLDALDRLPEQIRSRFLTRFIGRTSEQEREVFAGRKSRIEVLGFLPQSEALRLVEETDYLLLTMTNDISQPGKLFEYMVTGKPILALSPRHGEVHRILEQTRAGWCVEPEDSSAVCAMLERASEMSNGPAWFQPDWEAVRRFERPRLAAEYADLIRGSKPR